ncbi:MAG: tetratricopeptide repeat protein [Candidatus Zixiibacteriota bacterium]
MNRNIHILIFIVLILAVFGLSAQCEEKTDIDDKYERGRRLFEDGDLLPAASLFEEVIKYQPTNQSARDMLFDCYRFIGIKNYGQSRYQDAIDIWRKALLLDPENQEILRYIERCESEKRAIDIINGDTTAVIEKEPISTKAPPVRIDSSSTSSLAKVNSNLIPPPAHIDSSPTLPSGIIDMPSISTDTPVNLTSRKIICGLSYGITVATNDSHQPKTGRVFEGYLSIPPDRHRLGVKLDGIFSRFYRNSTATIETPQHLTVFGISINPIISSEVFHFMLINWSAGIGVYEIILTDPMDNQNSETTRESSVLGVNLGIAWRKNMGMFTATVGAKYILFYDSISPNLFQISIGIASN